MAQKQVLRSQVKQLLRGISQNDLIRQSKVIADEVVGIIKDYTHIACYLNMDHSEMKTEMLIESMFEQGKVVYLPRCSYTKSSSQVSLRKSESGHHGHLVFYCMSSMEQVNSLSPCGKYKLREPKMTYPEPLPPKNLEVILVPGVVFSMKTGGRMGHGAGYYDDYITRHVHYTGKRPLLIGLALEEQIVDSVPVEPHDHPMDCIVCGDGTVKWFN